MKVVLKICAILVITAAVVTFATANDAKFLANKPDFLNPCRLADIDFNNCFAKNFQVIFREWKDGIPGYKSAGSIDPLHVTRIFFFENALNAELLNVIVTGASKIMVKDARFNPKTLVSQIKLFTPNLSFDCDYKLNGHILNLALNGNGKAKFDVENFGMLLKMKLKLRDEYGYTFTDIDTLDLEVTEVGGLHVHFENLFNGQKALEDSTNAVFNENWRDFYEILHPAVSKAVEAIMKDRLSKAYSYVPGNFIVYDLPTAAEHKG